MTPLQRQIQQIRRRRKKQQQIRKKRLQQQRLKKNKLERKLKNQRKKQQNANKKQQNANKKQQNANKKQQNANKKQQNANKKQQNANKKQQNANKKQQNANKKQQNANNKQQNANKKQQNANNKQKLGDTHFYDGKIKEQYKIYRNYDEKNCVTFDYIFLLFNFNIVLDEITEFIQNYKGINDVSMKKNAIKTIHLFKTQDKHNYDPKNDIHVNDILPRVWRFIKNDKDVLIKTIFLEQIADISTKGACSQGRTTRLYQIYSMYMDNLMV